MWRSFNVEHTKIRGRCVDHVKRELVLQLGAESQGVDILRFTPDLLKDALRYLEWYNGERVRLGESILVVHIGNMGLVLIYRKALKLVTNPSYVRRL